MIEIKHKETGEVLFRVEADTLQGADLSRIDLRGANLRGTNLNNADLSYAILSLADLSNADLGYATLSNAHLRYATLRNANMGGAELTYADLMNADLKGADLRGASLLQPNLSDADLSEADLSGSYLSGATFTNCTTLHQAKGLDKIIHRGPSSLDTRTLRACINKLPDVFLQGVGYSQQDIDSLRSMFATGAMDTIQYATEVMDHSIKFYSCFLSHSGTDSDFADRLRQDLLDNEVKCWHHRYDMHGGKFWRPQISEAIKVNDKLILICTDQSVNNDNVAGEVIEAISREREAKSRKLFPLLLDGFILRPEALALADRKMAAQEWSEDWIRYVRQYHIPDFRQWEEIDTYTARFKELLHDLKNPPMREAQESRNTQASANKEDAVIDKSKFNQQGQQVGTQYNADTIHVHVPPVQRSEPEASPFTPSVSGQAHVEQVSGGIVAGTYVGVMHVNTPSPPVSKPTIQPNTTSIPSYVQQCADALNDYRHEIAENAIKVLAQTKHPSAKQVLVDALDHDIRHTRIYAALTVGKSGDARAVPCLLESLETEEESSLHEQAVRLLQNIGEPATAALCKLFDHSNSRVRHIAIEAASAFKDEGVVDALIAALAHEEGHTRGRVAVALSKIGGDGVVSTLKNTLQNGTPPARAAAADALGRLKEASAGQLLLQYLNDTTKVDHVVPTGENVGVYYHSMHDVVSLALQSIHGDTFARGRNQTEILHLTPMKRRKK